MRKRTNIYVDTSGSMNGPALACAQALAISCAEYARHNGDDVDLHTYSGPGEFSPPAKDYLDFLSCWYGGGTSFDRVLGNIVSAAEMCDLTAIIITDGFCGINPDLARKVNDTTARVVAVQLASPSSVWAEEALQEVADATVRLDPAKYGYNDFKTVLKATEPEPEPTEDPITEVVDLATKALKKFVTECLDRAAQR